MAEARRMGKSELFSHFADRFEVKRTQAREFFDELTTLAEKELKRSGEFVLPRLRPLDFEAVREVREQFGFAHPAGLCHRLSPCFCALSKIPRTAARACGGSG